MSADPELFLAIDQGGQSTRVAVADGEGRVVAACARRVATLSDGERVEQDADELVDSISSALDEVAERLGARRAQVVSAGLAVQRSSVVCWDRDTGEALSPALSWMDRRGKSGLAAAGLEAAAVRELTGLHLSPHYGASKLAWCLRELPAVARAARHRRLAMGPLASHLLRRLGDRRPHCVDATTAQRTLLWDRHAGDWSPELCRAFGIPPATLPPVVACDAGFGALALGRRRVPLAVCAGDQGLVPPACGPVRSDSVYVNAGTGAFVLLPLAADEAAAGLPDRGLLRTLAWSGGGGDRWLEEGTVNGAASALRRVAEDEFPVEAGAEACFLNGVGGLGSPWWIADYPSRFVGEPGPPARREGLVLDSIVHLIAANVRRLHRAPSRLVLTGGLAHRRDLRRALADALGLPVHVPAEGEATLRGVFVALAPALGDGDPGFAVVEPDPARRRAWDERQQRWESLLLARG